MEYFSFSEKLALASKYEEYRKFVKDNLHNKDLQATVEQTRLAISAIEKAMFNCGFKYSTRHKCFIER